MENKTSCPSCETSEGKKRPTQSTDEVVLTGIKIPLITWVNILIVFYIAHALAMLVLSPLLLFVLVFIGAALS